MRTLLASLILAASTSFAGTTSDPYTGTPISIAGDNGAVTIWEAETVDLGGEGIAFHALITGGCTVAICRCVQTFRTDGLPVCGVINPFVTYPGPGSWYNYTISTTVVGNYTVELLVAIGDMGCCGAAAYHIEVDGAPVIDPNTLKVASIPLGPTATAGWNSFEWRGKSPMFPMVPGTHKLRIVVEAGWFNWDSVRVKHAGGIEWQWGPVWKVYP